VSQPVSSNSIAVASALLGAIALITSWLVIGMVFGVAAVITGLVARKRPQAGAKKPATAGIALGVVSIVAGLVAVGYYYWLGAHQLDHYHECLINGTYRHC
jgi:hypothetical protein